MINFAKPIECTTPRMNPHINYGLWVIMMCHCRFTDCNKCTTVDLDSEGGCACVGTYSIWEFSVLSLNFAMNLKLI